MKIGSKTTVTVLMVLAGSSCVRAATSQISTQPEAAIRAAEAWAFPIEESPDPGAPRAQAPKVDPHELLHVPGSTRGYTQTQIDDFLFNPPDWFPQGHPAMPHVVAHGRKPAWACGSCHQPDGSGHPESAPLAGMPRAYIIEQVKAFRDGERAAASMRTALAMAMEARNLGDADLQQAAAYFSSLKFRPVTRVVETASVSTTHWDGFVHVPDTNGAREPIGERIIETPVNFKLVELGDAHDGFIAYVPSGSIARGAVIAAQGKGQAASCESCHGTKLEGQTMPGIGVVPPLAGRSPTYIARELILFREGKRMNSGAAPMRAEASQLTVPEMIDVAAYVASQKP